MIALPAVTEQDTSYYSNEPSRKAAIVHIDSHIRGRLSVPVSKSLIQGSAGRGYGPGQGVGRVEL